MPLKKTTTPTTETGPSSTNRATPWLSMTKAPTGGFVVLKATLVGREVQNVEVLAGPLGRGAAAAALRVEVARTFLVGKGPQ